ncbi:MAG: hypothetical protein ABF572_04710 [Gluconobacter sp.]|uniref:hypothetical protein n=1 Tax=Gluconobacter sp. TaxID=1876758 RepID=UPI0039ED9031
MTTIIIDLKSKIIAADSRTNLNGKEDDNFSIFFDGAANDKIIFLEKYGLVFCFAGHGPTGISWKKWLLNESVNFPAYPQIMRKMSLDGYPEDYLGAIIFVVDLNKSDPEIIVGDRRLINYSGNGDAIFIGTGKKFAQEEWEKSYSAIKSIQFSAEKDIKTGGPIKYIKFSDFENNLSKTHINHCEQRRLFRTAGMVVYEENLQKKIPASLEAARNAIIEIRLKEQDDLATTMDPNSDYPTSASIKPVWPECEKVRVEELLRRLMPDRFQ